MGSLTISEIPYIAAMNGDWQSMIDYYQEHAEFSYSPVTLSLDTGFHLAVHSNAERPLKDLLEILGVGEFLTEKRNKFGNTVLHEATIYGNYEAVVLLVERCPDLISILNDFGETPLFTAAAFGEAKIVEYLIATRTEKCVDCNGCILSIHRQRSKDGESILHQRSKDGLSILGAAIIGQHFETALLLLELDESLHNLEDKMGRTALNLLAEMPTGFESGYPMGIFERLIYSCLPVIRHHEVKSQVQTWRRAMQDLESGTLRSNLLNYLKDPKESKMISNLLRCRFLPQDMEHYRGGTKPGPALKLQEELRWFEKVQEVIPSHYVTLRNDEGKTAEELFKESHQDQLKNAQKWIKETTQSCSTVAALVATVVFAAAYTVPGGSDKNGTPNFINSPYFLVFTVSDVLSLASSLTSLVVFLSLLTSPFELQEFHISLPRKLLFGFTFLFFAVITTMLSFGATILILIQSEKKLTTLLLSIAAFLPVLVFAIMQFRLYVSFMGSTYNILKITGKARTPFRVPCLPRQKKLRRVAYYGRFN